MRSKQYFTSIKNNPHEISTDPVYLLFHNKSDTLHYLFAIPSAFTLSRDLEL